MLLAAGLLAAACGPAAPVIEGNEVRVQPTPTEIPVNPTLAPVVYLPARQALVDSGVAQRALDAINKRDKTSFTLDDCDFSLVLKKETDINLRYAYDPTGRFYPTYKAITVSCSEHSASLGYRPGVGFAGGAPLTPDQDGIISRIRPVFDKS